MGNSGIREARLSDMIPGTTAYNALHQYQPITRQEKAISPAIILDQLLNMGKPIPGSTQWLKNLEDWDALATQRRLERDRGANQEA